MNSTISSSSCRPLGQGAIYSIYNLAIYNIAKLVVIFFFNWSRMKKCQGNATQVKVVAV